MNAKLHTVRELFRCGDLAASAVNAAPRGHGRHGGHFSSVAARGGHGNILAQYRREADTDTARHFSSISHEADTSSAEAARNSPAAHREHIETGAAVTGAAVLGSDNWGGGFGIRTTGLVPILGLGLSLLVRCIQLSSLLVLSFVWVLL